ncbi:hypothetical protein ACFOWE_23195 [Planomonospora corallina]|uniref:DUF7824 domain-containing protein n=1 Tax=Planomonospora corallina TaxID=1806052 RepID=A0ABV8IAV4_9ACTN
MHRDDRGYRRGPWWDIACWAAAMVRELTEPGAERRAHPDGLPTVAERVPEAGRGPIGKIMPLARYAEVHRALVEGELPPYLLATPTRTNGLLDPEALVERLEGYERGGVEALPLDLRQALLRLRRTVTGETAARAARLTGRAGRTAARWLTDRPADPETVLRREGGSSVVAGFVFPGPECRELLGDLLDARTHEESCESLLAVFAGYREPAAALLARGPGRFAIGDLHRLAAAEGPAGPGLMLVLARFLLEGPDGGAALGGRRGGSGQEAGRFWRPVGWTSVTAGEEAAPAVTVTPRVSMRLAKKPARVLESSARYP